MKIILVRHGQTKENLHKILQGGRIGGTLSQKGVEDTEKLGAWMLENNINIEVIFCSDLNRTRQTLEILKQYIKCPKIYFTSKLREQDFGDWTGKKYDENVCLDIKDVFNRALRAEEDKYKHWNSIKG